jgi:hypothetical protein
MVIYSMIIDEMSETEVENLPNLGREIETIDRTRHWNRFGGFCEECGGTGRSESGCMPCSVCYHGKL